MLVCMNVTYVCMHVCVFIYRRYVYIVLNILWLVCVYISTHTHVCAQKTGKTSLEREPLLPSPPRRFTTETAEQPALERRLARTEEQLLDMQQMLPQILMQLGAPPPPQMHHISSDREDDDSMPSPAHGDIFEPSDATFSALADDARTS